MWKTFDHREESRDDTSADNEALSSGDPQPIFSNVARGLKAGIIEGYRPPGNIGFCG